MDLIRKLAVPGFAMFLITVVALLAPGLFGTPVSHQNPTSKEPFPSLELASASKAGAAASSRLRPRPARAKFDKGPAYAKGCANLRRDAKVVACRFGERDAPISVALFGDSHALQYSPTLIKLARKRNLELVTYLRGSCVIARVNFESRCNRWRTAAIRRIAKQKPDVIAVSSATGNTYRVKRGGKKLNRRKSERFLRTGMARTLRKLTRVRRQNGGRARVVLLRDQALSPFRPPDCLKKNAHRPARCAFRTRRPNPPGFDWAGAKRVQRVKIVNPMGYFCGRKWCPAVSGNIVVFRDKYHISATYARTMTGWLARRLGI